MQCRNSVSIRASSMAVQIFSSRCWVIMASMRALPNQIPVEIEAIFRVLD
jgi:hypothetical protein